MSCANQLNLTAYLDGELSLAERTDLDAHLPGCVDCRQLKTQLERSLVLLRTLPEVAPARRSRAAVLARIEQPATFWEQLRSTFYPGLLMPSLGVAGAMALAWGINVNHPSNSPAHGALDLGQAELAANLDLVEDLDVVGLDREEDIDVIEHLDELEAAP